jgi:hypothetical protein
MRRSRSWRGGEGTPAEKAAQEAAEKAAQEAAEKAAQEAADEGSEFLSGLSIPTIPTTTAELEATTDAVKANLTAKVVKEADDVKAEAVQAAADMKNLATQKTDELSNQLSNVAGFDVSKISLNPFSTNEVQVPPVVPPTPPVVPAGPPVEIGGQLKKPWYKFWGGKHGTNHMKGGQNLGLNYYATPVHGIKMADPTYMEYYKGGKRSTSKRRSSKRSTRKRRSRKCRKTCNKRHRHCRK